MLEYCFQPGNFYKNNLKQLTFSYRNINTKIYMGVFLSIVILVNCYFIYLPYNYLPEATDVKVMCVILDAMGGGAAEKWFLTCVTICLLDLIVYTSVWFIIRFRAGASDSIRKIFRSLQVSFNSEFDCFYDSFIDFLNQKSTRKDRFYFKSCAFS